MEIEYGDVEEFFSSGPLFRERLSIAHCANEMIEGANFKLAKEGKRVDCGRITGATVSFVIAALRIGGYDVKIPMKKDNDDG